MLFGCGYICLMAGITTKQVLMSIAELKLFKYDLSGFF